MSKAAPIALLAAQAPTASVTGPWVEISNYTGNGHLLLNAATPASGQTLDVKLQHSRDAGVSDAAADAGMAFTQVGNATANGFQSLAINVDGLKAYVRTVSTIAGGSTALPHSVELYGKVAR